MSLERQSKVYRPESKGVKKGRRRWEVEQPHARTRICTRILGYLLRRENRSPTSCSRSIRAGVWTTRPCGTVVLFGSQAYNWAFKRPRGGMTVARQLARECLDAEAVRGAVGSHVSRQPDVAHGSVPCLWNRWTETVETGHLGRDSHWKDTVGDMGRGD